jgi:hypothetical protein
MHTTVSKSQKAQHTKMTMAKYISIMNNCRTPKEIKVVQSVDYAAIHVGKKYPSPYPSTVYKPS